MTVELVTGKGVDSHVGSDDIGLYNARTIGPGRYILSGCEASVVNANTVRIGEGEMLIDGRYVRVKGSEDVAIQSGVVDKKRIDLIAVRYSKGTDGVEDSPIAAIPGTPTAGEPADPAHVDGSILDGDVDVDIPVYRVRVDGLAVGDPELLIDQGPEPYVGHTHPASDIAEGIVAVERGGTGKGALVGSDSLLKAMFDASLTGAGYIPVFTDNWADGGYMTKQALRNAMGLGNTLGVLPAANGGTGVTSAARIGLMAYPVNAIYPSRAAANPAALFGGTWAEITDSKLFLGIYLYRRTA